MALSSLITVGPTAEEGTKAALCYRLEVPPGGETTVCLRLSSAAEPIAEPFGEPFRAIFADRVREADAFHAARLRPELDLEA